MKEPLEKQWWAEYDLDGSWEIYFQAERPQFYSHGNGPFGTFIEAKSYVAGALNDCIRELRDAKSHLRSKKASEYE